MFILPFVKGGDTIIATSTGKSHKIHSFIYCNTRYIVYVITCTICSIKYVGRTTRRLRDRLYDHLHDIETFIPRIRLASLLRVLKRLSNLLEVATSLSYCANRRSGGFLL